MKLGKHGCFIAGLTNFIGDTQSGMGGFSYTNLVEYGFECELCIEKSGVYSKEPQQSEAS